MADTDYGALLKSLITLPDETEWVEFKHNNSDPEKIGELISGLSNAAALHKRDRAFLVWGVKDKTHETVGTSFRPRKKKVGNQDLENWLSTQLRPRVQFWIREFSVDDKPCVVFEIDPATHSPIAFKGREWIRVGSHNKPLHEHDEKERVLWQRFGRESFESGTAMNAVDGDHALRLLRYSDYFDLYKKSIPPSKDAVLDSLCAERILRQVDVERFDITNLGAILFARDLHKFETLVRKAPRVVSYRGENRASSASERPGQLGYASGFAGLIRYIHDTVPKSEEIREALRVEVPMYPRIAIRELVANALIHQDFAAVGMGPMIEIFSDRIEIMNPGTPLIDVQRFLDLPARSRNEKLASLMRSLHICEERGTGIDKTLVAVELHQLPPPDFRLVGDCTRVVLFAPKEFGEMTKAERIRACYQHAGLQAVSDREMTNESLRRRFSIAEANYAMVSRIIRDTLQAGLIRPADPTSKSKRYARYVPFWA